jgi:CRISPR system Cascade subunit CasA
MNNLLTQPFIHITPGGVETLPGVLARLARDEVEVFPALRPHQAAAWHMFLVQLAALALNRAGRTAITEGEDEWLSLLRGLTPDFPNDEPWCLVVEDRQKPAFMQPPVPEGVKVENPVATPDALDLLITSKNHDLKQEVAREGEAQDWLFALMSLQTSEGFGGAGNYGISRMNGGSSSRPMLGLAPLPAEPKAMTPRPGAWFRRDVEVLVKTRDEQLERFSFLHYPASRGIGLTWLAPWPEGSQLQTSELDIWFIETCRRIRLRSPGGVLSAVRGTSKATHINAKHLKGALGDPWAPIHRGENKSFTLGDGSFDYRTMTRLLLGERKNGQDSQDWDLPVLALPFGAERDGATMAVAAAALARGNSKTEGFKSRALPIGGREALALSLGPSREALHALARQQMEEIGHFDRALRNALALAAAEGEHDKIKQEHYEMTRGSRDRFDRAADEIFFEHLWARFEAQDKSTETVAEKRNRFVEKLWPAARAIFEAELPAMPCAGIFRPRAEARASGLFMGIVRRAFPELFPDRKAEETDDAAA